MWPPHIHVPVHSLRQGCCSSGQCQHGCMCSCLLLPATGADKPISSANSLAALPRVVVHHCRPGRGGVGSKQSPYKDRVQAEQQPAQDSPALMVGYGAGQTKHALPRPSPRKAHVRQLNKHHQHSTLPSGGTTADQGFMLCPFVHQSGTQSASSLWHLEGPDCPCSVVQQCACAACPC